MRLSRTALVPLTLVLVLLGAGLATAQDQPRAAGSDGVPVPKKKKHVQPVYPPAALAQGIRGIVILDLVIDTDGRVASTSILRSIPGLDEAALVAARQWQYEPVRVDGEAVSVRLTVPVTFALKLPEVSRDEGIPDLRQGVTPPWPAEGGAGGGQAVADVTLEPDGRIGLARIVEGDEPWSTSLLQALRTWRFRAPPENATISFQIAAEYVADGKKGKVELRLSDLRESPMFDAAPPAPGPATAAAPEPPAPAPVEPPGPAEPEPTPGAAPASETPGEVVEQPASPAATAQVTTPATAPAPEPEAQAHPAPEAPGAPAADPSDAGAPSPAPAAPEPAAGPPPATPEADLALLAEEAAEVASGGAVTGAPPPVIEVLTAAPPPLPPENGISALRGVELEPGVPDLTRGRRPVSPPLARMQGASGEVTVEFSVSAGGVTSVQRADGPEVFRAAATAAVESWVFRRTRADRAYLVAVFTYEDALASAIVRPQPAR